MNSRIDIKWHNFYESEHVLIPEEVDHVNILIFEGMEKAINNHLQNRTSDSREYWSNWFEGWNSWEKQANVRNVIFIGCDLSKGIVPMEQCDRLWRDITGWCYQDLARLSNRVDIIWNGLPQTIKGGYLE